MSRFAIPLAGLVIAVAGCAATVEGTRDSYFASDTAEMQVLDGRGEDRPAAACLTARVTDGVIQLHRVVVTLDIGASEGVRVGMTGVLPGGRQLKIISVDHHTSRAVITGLNVRIAPGTEACLFIEKR